MAERQSLDVDRLRILLVEYQACQDRILDTGNVALRTIAIIVGAGFAVLAFTGQVIFRERSFFTAAATTVLGIGIILMLEFMRRQYFARERRRQLIDYERMNEIEKELKHMRISHIHYALDSWEKRSQEDLPGGVEYYRHKLDRHGHGRAFSGWNFLERILWISEGLWLLWIALAVWAAWADIRAFVGF
jgi:hypothetical protein